MSHDASHSGDADLPPHAFPDPADWDPEVIAWQDVGPDGTKYAVLAGRRDAPGEPFTYAFFIPAGFWDPPHRHTANAWVTVVEGTLCLGYGERHDEGALWAFKAGSRTLVPANAAHFDGSFENTLIVGTAVGPWETHYVDPVAPASAGTGPASTGEGHGLPAELAARPDSQNAPATPNPETP